ncbi:hypothetical protein SEVIR_5G379450v4 [Setaria viridis]
MQAVPWWLYRSFACTWGPAHAAGECSTSEVRGPRPVCVKEDRFLSEKRRVALARCPQRGALRARRAAGLRRSHQAKTKAPEISPPLPFRRRGGSATSTAAASAVETDGQLPGVRVRVPPCLVGSAAASIACRAWVQGLRVSCVTGAGGSPDGMHPRRHASSATHEVARSGFGS